MAKKVSVVRDALVSAVAAMIIAAVAMVLIAHKIYWALIPLIVGVATFIGVLRFHPSKFYRRIVWACVGLLTFIVAIPAFRAVGILGEKSAFVIMVDSIGTGGFIAASVLCIIAIIVCAFMERLHSREEINRDEEKNQVRTQSQIIQQQAGTASNSPVIGYAKTVKIEYEKKPEKQETVREKIEGIQWPGVSVPEGGPKVTVPFAGRKEELKKLAAAMQKGEGIVAVVGAAGQGKSCLTGQWYQRGARPKQGIGLFWRKVYESGYTFDRFLDELYQYLTAEEIDRQRFNSTEARSAVVEQILGDRPCWIVLDGVERWLRRWARAPDADAAGATEDDRAAQEPALDKFLQGASLWTNGSQLLLTTRAVPGALDERLVIRIGQKQRAEPILGDLQEADALTLLSALGVNGDKETMLAAVRAYACHPFAVHVLGNLLRDLYGGDIKQWQQVNPLEGKIEGLFEKVIETRLEDLDLLEHVASSVGPAPVEMLAKFSGEAEPIIRRRLAALAKWQMVEFEGSRGEADQHTVVRRFLLTGRLGQARTKAIRRQIALWWAEHQVPDSPEKIDQILPLLKAVEHLTAAGDADAATHIFFTQWSERNYYNLYGWLLYFGYLDDCIRINTETIEISKYLIEEENQLKLRNKMAMCYNGRGIALRTQGNLAEAIADYGRAIDIYIQLVEKEARLDLRHDLAGCYNNRGLALANQGNLAEAIADFGRAIDIYRHLVEQESRLDLCNDLAHCYNNRGNALRAQGNLAAAISDLGRAIEIRVQLVENEGHLELRHDLASCYNNRGNALRIKGNPDAAIADFGRAIEIYVQLVEQESRLELRNDLAHCYNNRGLALTDQGNLSESIADYNRAIEIRVRLVEKEARLELRNDLAMCYNNRGNVLLVQGNLAAAISDYGRAIEIYRQLVDKEARRELRHDLSDSLFNRALTLGDSNQWHQAGADIKISESLLREVIIEGQRHLVGSYLQTAGWRCRFAQQLGDIGEAARWVNDAMQWFLEEAQSGRKTELLLAAAQTFAENVKENLKVLARAGLDEQLWSRFGKAMGE